MNSHSNLVEVYRAAGELEALTIKNMLESFGISALLRSNAAGSVHPFVVDGMGEFKVMVKEEDVQEARFLISDNKTTNRKNDV